MCNHSQRNIYLYHYGVIICSYVLDNFGITISLNKAFTKQTSNLFFLVITKHVPETCCKNVISN